MHLPDGFLNNNVSWGLIAVSVGFLVAGVAKVRQAVSQKVRQIAGRLSLADGPETDSTVSENIQLTDRGKEKIKMMAALGALIFALQMINFPVLNGTSGHLIGGVLAAVILGPWAGLLVISSVLIVQSLIFADGGIIALGANIFNMGIVACLGGYFIYKKIASFSKVKSSRLIKFIIIGLIAWLSVVMASLFCALEIGFSKTIDFSLVIPAMVKIHFLIGLGEAILTILIIKVLKLKLDES